MKEEFMKVLGITDEINVCECCGKTNLKRAVALETASGEVVHYGVDCADRAINGKGTRSGAAYIRKQGEAMALARKWLAAGHEAKVVAKGLWNRYGFPVEARGQAIRFNFGEVAL